MQKSELVEVEIEDLRVRRTRLMLQEALLALTVEKGFAAITVRDITERAMVNRSTFYRHYLDKYDLLEQYTDELYATIFSDGEHMEPETSDQAPPGLIRLLRHIRTFGDFYRVMLGKDGDSRFVEHFRQNVENRMRYLMEISGSKMDGQGTPLDMRLSYVSCANIGAILWWLEKEPERTPEQFALMLDAMVTSSMGFSFRREPSAT